MTTTTAADYTVEIEIDKSDFHEWYRSVYKKEGGDFSKEIPSSLSFKNHLISVIEEKLTKKWEKVLRGSYSDDKVLQDLLKSNS